MQVSFINNLKDSSIQISFYNIFFKYSLQLEKNIYITHINCKDIVTLSTLRFIFKANEKAIGTLVKNDLNLNKNNSILFSIFELQQGIKFTPDINFLRKILKFRKQVEETYNILLCGFIFIFPRNYSKKQIEILISLLKFFKVKFPIKIVYSYKDALTTLNKFSRLKSIKIKKVENIIF